MTITPEEVATYLARKRWDKATSAEKKKVGKMLAEGRKAISPEVRSAAAKKAAAARWAGKKKVAKKRPA